MLVVKLFVLLLECLSAHEAEATPDSFAVAVKLTEDGSGVHLRIEADLAGAGDLFACLSDAVINAPI